MTSETPEASPSEGVAPPHSDRTLVVRSVLATILVYLLGALHHASVNEDAFISFRFAKHLREGVGLRFNLDDPAPVEGFSNFLWVLLAAAFQGVEPFPGFGVNTVSWLCGAGTVLLVGWSARRHLKLDLAASLGVMLILAMFTPFVVWSISGMETVAQCLCFTAAALLLSFEDRPVPLALGAAAALGLALVRTEGIFWLPILAALAAGLRAYEGRPIKRLLGPALLAVVALWSVYFAWKVYYFGTAISTVATAKLGGGGVKLWERGLLYVTASALALVTPFLVLLVPAAFRDLERPARGLLVLVLLCAAPAYSVATGGDYMVWFRFIVQGAPFLALALGILLHGLATRVSRPIAGAAAVFVAVLGYVPSEDISLVPRGILNEVAFVEGAKFRGGTFGPFWHREPDTNPILHFLPRDPYEPVGTWLAVRAFVAPGQSVVLGGIGRNGYYNDAVHIVDRCGLVADYPWLAELRRAGRGKKAGHDNCFHHSNFQRLEPDVLILKAVWVTYGRDSDRVEELARWIAPVDLHDQYYPDFTYVTRTARGKFYAVGLRRAESPEDRIRGQLAYQQKLERLDRGELEPFVVTEGREARYKGAR